MKTAASVAQLPLPFEHRLERAYHEWIAANPDVFQLFLQFAMQMLATRRRFGMRLIAERVRWEIATTWPHEKQGFKINDHHTPYIARDIMARLPALKDLIETRVTRGERQRQQDSNGR